MDIIAHRGSSGITPENTIFSIITALYSGANIVEIDVQLSKDNVVILFHDRSFERIDNDPQSVKDYTYDELLNKEIGALIDGYSGLKIPKFKDVVNQFSTTDFIIEIKPQVNDISRTLESKVLSILDRTSYTFDHGYISVRDVETLNWFRDASTKYPVGLMQKKRSVHEFRNLCLQNEVCIAQIRRISYDQESVAELKRIVDRVNVYPAHNLTEWKQVSSWDIDGILTNYPSALKAYLQLYGY